VEGLQSHGRGETPEAGQAVMEIRFERPPMWAEIDARFHVAGKPVIFAWGNIIYNPESIIVTPDLLAHEMVHGGRQGETVQEWWLRYIADEAFRYEEELLAHRVEFEFLAAGEKDRNRLSKLLHRTAARLGSPLYGWRRPHYAVIRDLKSGKVGVGS
jgi:hypothetical protein